MRAILEGCRLRSLDEREQLARLAADVGYFNNAKKPKFNKIFNKEREEKRIHEIFNGKPKRAKDKHKILAALDHFKERG
ncbi:hypothetical protein FC16_GL000034 [Loigolactobacillus coryniformis subsp. torquens DSM 20004 = KCTC 3535]|uniref:hypothetical protein n=1 Tax=Loigolactobacillus coryniformis TaxID=1610 RepID=UPI0002196243|nr:hypothetical protein [Loigolactobacillus coryniformis]KRK85642.1 hypothetical protein FC16_GL000034 [Loigolactobacillus coryniformis subsp. torquens DSM 20004 = KCTC 3535]